MVMERDVVAQMLALYLPLESLRLVEPTSLFFLIFLSFYTHTLLEYHITKIETSVNFRERREG